MHSEESAAKYLNSPETVIFNKRRLLFPIYQALPEIRRKRQAIMVEGYMDAISLHAHGIKMWLHHWEQPLLLSRQGS